MKPALNPPTEAPAEPTLTLPLPPKGHHYLALPDDIRATAFTSDALHSLIRIGNGDLVAELAEKFPELISACSTLNQKGSLTLKVSIAPGGMGKMEINYDVSSKVPKEKKHSSLLFCTQKGQLLNRDPAQLELDLRTAALPKMGELRVVEIPAPQPLR